MAAKTAIFIPARMQSVRLPGKPLLDIGGVAMILHVYKRAVEASIGNVYVACDSQEIANVVEQAGGRAILTDPNHHSGTDRIYEALQHSDDDVEFIINVQGDLPTIEPALIQRAAELLNDPKVDIATLAAPITDSSEITDPHVVKAVIALNEDNGQGKALYFTRSMCPYGEGRYYHHIGLYAYRKNALERFENLPPSPLEKREKLEQLRALENDMRIEVAIVDTIPLGVDTEEDLIKAREHFSL